MIKYNHNYINATHMLHFQEISLTTFLNEYWQKKPLVIRNALPQFINHVSPDELAGLALEEDIESRIVKETPNASPQWHLTRGPFSEKDFTALPATHWTLLVQGVDKIIPEVSALLDEFKFLPPWRFDDVMISYAADQGSVGPHYDHYDVFLYQAMGRRKWSLTSQNCTLDNYIPDLELRIMEQFNTEEEFILEEGDMLYLPPHIGHHGIALSQECMTYSFGYRSYTGQELLDSLSDYVAAKDLFKNLYTDPNWSHLKNSSEIPPPAWQQAQKLLSELINDEHIMRSWFGCFATRLDQQSEQHLSEPCEDDVTINDFFNDLAEAQGLTRDPCCRFAYSLDAQQHPHLYINGIEWDVSNVSPTLIKILAEHHFIALEHLAPFLQKTDDCELLWELWKLQWLLASI